ncbi:MAG: hypothetical protein ABJH63_07700 [Rhizobiaceae bacterium]
MTKLITVIAVAASVLIMPNVSAAAGTFSNAQAFNDSAQVIQIKETRQRNRGRARHNRKHNRKHSRHVGGHFFFDHDYHGGYAHHSCRRLERKAYRTGSRYWWNKYRFCMRHRY